MDYKFDACTSTYSPIIAPIVNGEKKSLCLHHSTVAEAKATVRKASYQINKANLKIIIIRRKTTVYIIKEDL